MESDLKKMILDIIKFNIIKERGVTELLFFNEFHLTINSITFYTIILSYIALTILLTQVLIPH